MGDGKAMGDPCPRKARTGIALPDVTRGATPGPPMCGAKRPTGGGSLAGWIGLAGLDEGVALPGRTLDPVTPGPVLLALAWVITEYER